MATESAGARGPKPRPEPRPGTGSSPDPRQELPWYKCIGPGLITGAADDDPSGIGTYSATGAQSGYMLLWLVPYCIPLMIAVQEMCGRVGAITGMGLAAVLKAHYPRWLLYLSVAMLLGANLFNVYADLNVMAASADMLLHIPFRIGLTAIAIAIVLLQIYVPYRIYSKLLKWLCVSLAGYVIVAFLPRVHNDWHAVFTHLWVPHLNMDKDSVLLVVAFLGTTISPYLFFWQAGETVEEEVEYGEASEPGHRRTKVTDREIKNIRADTTLGMIVSQLVAFFIVVATAGVLFRHGSTEINTAQDAAKGLAPLGEAAYWIFTICIIGTGLLAIPTLAGSAAYAVAEMGGWRYGLYRRFNRAPGFYLTIAAMVLIGYAMNFIGAISPVKALVYSAALNGIVAPPLIVVLLLICNNRKIVGERKKRNLVEWLWMGDGGAHDAVRGIPRLLDPERLTRCRYAVGALLRFPLANLPQLPRPAALRRPSHLADIAVLLGTFLLIYGLGKVGAGFFVAFKPPYITPDISLDVRFLPYYAARSTLRMFIALFLSFWFSLGYGYAAAKSPKAERVLVPLLDILQSVPVLGFLSITVTGFIALFPGSLFGLECASIFAIFTAQAWNMTFSFYHSLITLPKELDEAARLFRLSKWKRFWTVEVPTSMIGLVWNGMMSFGGGWFFLAASEAISVLNKSYTLPGIGSYVAKAVTAGDSRALIWAIVAMVVVILLVDQLFWKPIVAWSQKFRLEKSASATQVHSWVLDLFRTSRLPRFIGRRYRRWQVHRWRPHVERPQHTPWFAHRRRRRWRVNDDLLFGVAVGLVCAASLYFGYRFVTTEVGAREVGTAFGLGLLTLLRVLVLIAFATLVWTPIGVAIGFSPKLARTMQPLAQLAASFPANFLFPAATILFIKIGLSLDWGSMLLMALGSQWYVLFNAIAGAMAVPTDLREMCSNMGLRGWPLWQKLIIPAIFPAWVTGAVTASGGAWNASIVSEVVSWKDKTLTAHGLGSYIAAATGKGDWPRIVLGVFAMCVFVVTVNRLVWRRLYSLAEDRYRLG